MPVPLGLALFRRAWATGDANVNAEGDDAKDDGFDSMMIPAAKDMGFGSAKAGHRSVEDFVVGVCTSSHT